MCNWLLMNVNWKWITTPRYLINKTGGPIPKVLKEVCVFSRLDSFRRITLGFVCLNYRERVCSRDKLHCQGDRERADYAN